MVTAAVGEAAIAGDGIRELALNGPFPGGLLTPGQVARLWNVDLRTVTRWAITGKVTYLRTPGGHRRFPAAQFAAITGPLLTPEQVGCLFQVSPGTPAAWAATGKVTCIRTPGGQRRFPAAQFVPMLAGLSPPPVPPPCKSALGTGCPP